MLLTLSLASLLNVIPADTTTGTWRIQGDVSGFPVDQTCDVQVVDTVLTGKCTSSDGNTVDITGEADEENVKFQHAGDYEGEPLTVIYTGTFHSPTEVRGTILVQPFNVSGYFTARPVEQDAAVGE